MISCIHTSFQTIISLRELKQSYRQGCVPSGGTRVGSSSICVFHLLQQQSPTLLTPETDFVEDNFFQGLGVGSGLGMIQSHYIYYTLLSNAAANLTGGTSPQLRIWGLQFYRSPLYLDLWSSSIFKANNGIIWPLLPQLHLFLAL